MNEIYAAASARRDAETPPLLARQGGIVIGNGMYMASVAATMCVFGMEPTIGLMLTIAATTVVGGVVTVIVAAMRSAP